MMDNIQPITLKIGHKVYTPLGLAGAITELDLAKAKERWVVEVVGPNKLNYTPAFYEEVLIPISDELYEAMEKLNVRVVGYTPNSEGGHYQSIMERYTHWCMVEEHCQTTGSFSVWNGKYNQQAEALEAILKEYRNRRGKDGKSNQITKYEQCSRGR